MVSAVADDVAERLKAAGSDLSRLALEALALEEYRRRQLTKPDLRRLLGLGTRDALDGFLKAHDVFEPYSLDDSAASGATWSGSGSDAACPGRGAARSGASQTRDPVPTGLQAAQ
jgi:hypothetical protein